MLPAQSRNRSWLTRLPLWAIGLSPILCFLGLVAFAFVVNEPGSRSALEQLQSELASIQLPSKTVQLETELYRKPATDLVSVRGHYATKLPFGDIRSYYDLVLANQGWQLLSEATDTQSRNTIDYCKGEYTGRLTYASGEYELELSRGYQRECTHGTLTVPSALTMLWGATYLMSLGALSLFAGVGGQWLGTRTIRGWRRPEPEIALVSICFIGAGLFLGVLSAQSLWRHAVGG